MRKKSYRLLFICLLAIGCVVACAKRETPEQRVRALISEAEKAVEKKELGQLKGYISEHYTDDDGRDRKAVEAILRLYVLRNESIHLFTRIESVTITPPNRVQAIVYVAMAARPITKADELRNFNANLYRFEVSFAEEDKQWRVIRTAWRPAEPSDFVL